MVLVQQLVKGMSGAVPVQDFPGSIVEHRLHPLDLGSRQPSEPCPFGKELTQQAHVGSLVTVSQPVLTPAARRQLASKTNAIAVGMESQTIAALCRERGIACLALKAVSDGLDDNLSPILGGFDIIHIPRIALRVAIRPATWPLAVRLAKHSHLAADHLGHAVWAVLTRFAQPAIGSPR